MTRNLKTLVEVTLAAAVAELLFLPFNYLRANGLYQWLGYRFIMQPPEMQRDGQVIVAWDHLILQVTVTAFIAVAWYLLNYRFGTDSRPVLSQDRQPARFT